MYKNECRSFREAWVLDLHGSLAGAVAREGGMGVISTAVIGFREEDAWTHPVEAGIRALKEEIEKAGKSRKERCHRHQRHGGYHGIQKELSERGHQAGVDAVISGAGCLWSFRKLREPGCDAGAGGIQQPGGAHFDRPGVEETRPKPDFIVVEGGFRCRGHLGFSGRSAGSRDQSLEDIVKRSAALDPEIPVFAAGSVFDAEDIRRMTAAGAEAYRSPPGSSLRKNAMPPRIQKSDSECGEGPPHHPESGRTSGKTVDSPPLQRRVDREGRVAPKRCRNCIRELRPEQHQVPHQSGADSGIPRQLGRKGFSPGPTWAES